MARGVRYAVDNGAKVLNMSIGRSGPAGPLLQEALIYADDARRVRRRLRPATTSSKGIRPNGRPRTPTRSRAWLRSGRSAAIAQRAYYSKTGPYVEFAAPGGNQRAGGTTGGILQQTFDFNFVDTYVNGPARYGPPRFDIFAYQFFQGTSMATPHVSGFAALLMQQGITSPAAIEAAMEQFATDLGPAGRDDQYGYGLINPRASLRGMGLAK